MLGTTNIKFKKKARISLDQCGSFKVALYFKFCAVHKDKGQNN